MARVCVGYVHPDQVSVLFHTSLMRTLLGRHAGRVTVGGGLAAKFSSANISNARNEVVREFLAMKGKPEWLWMVDTDMEWDEDALERLLRSAHDPETGAVSALIVGGLCFGTLNGELWPTMYEVDTADDGTVSVFRYEDYPQSEMVRVGATGAAFLLVHRSVFERIAEHGFDDTYPWFQETSLNGMTCGEDFTFCLRAREVGIPVWVNTDVRVGHHKTHVLREDVFLAQQEAKRKAVA